MSGNRSRHWILAVLLPGLVCAACAGLQAPVEVTGGAGGDKSVSITASSFEFRPNNIVAKAGGWLSLTVENSSVTMHNLTVKAPDGVLLADVDLPGKSVTAVRVPLAKPGIYEFYCAKTMHPTFGMKGQIEAR